MFLTIRKWSALYVLTFLLLFLGFAAILWRGAAINASKLLTLRQAEGLVLVIDPGHGGEDGGAQAADGTVESEINLAVSHRIRDLAELVGVETVMTREGNEMLGSGETVRQRKVSDLRSRAEMANGVPGGVLISIHQNSLPEDKGVHGAQVFYNNVPGSAELAQSVQDALNITINDRPKETKAAGSGIYVLQNARCKSVLVECGFMSNSGETEKLKSEGYQTRIAVTVFAAVMEGLYPGGTE